MRCSCQNCGTYMVQDEKGLQSRCICPQCFNTCNACMGTQQQPVQREGLALIAFLREQHGEKEQPREMVAPHSYEEEYGD